MIKGFLYSQDGSYAFPLAPKVTTIGRENCDISINSPHVDPQHALMEFDVEQRCFILKDLNSSTGTFVHDCRVQNAAVRLADGDFIRFGFNGLPLEFRLEHENVSTMPSIYPRQSNTNSLQMITQTIPSRRATSTTSNYPQQIDVRQNPGFSLRSRPVSAGAKKTLECRANAWTTSQPLTNPSRSFINGSFVGELDVNGADTSELTTRVDQLEKEVKGRDAEIRHLNERLKSLEPIGSTFSNEVQTLRTELEKVRREKQAASGLISSLQRDLHSKDSNMAKLGREIDVLKNDSRDKDLRIQSLQGKLNHVRDRTRLEEDRQNKEKDAKLKQTEEKVTELTENVQRLKLQIVENEKQISKTKQNEEKLRVEIEQIRQQSTEIQQSENNFRKDLAEIQRKRQEFYMKISRCFSSNDNDDEYDDDEENLLERIRQVQNDFQQMKTNFEREENLRIFNDEKMSKTFDDISEIFLKTLNEPLTIGVLRRTRDEICRFDQNERFSRTMTNFLDEQIRSFSQLFQLVSTDEDQQTNLTTNDAVIFLRQRFEEFQREKENLIEQISIREENLREEFQRENNDKDLFWQKRLDDEIERFRLENEQNRIEDEEKLRLFTDQIDRLQVEKDETNQKFVELQNETTEKIFQLKNRLEQNQSEFDDEKREKDDLIEKIQAERDAFSQMEKDKNRLIEDLNGQLEVFKDQVRQFSLTIVQLEKKVDEEQEKRIRCQAELDQLNNQLRSSKRSSPDVETVVPVVPVLTAPIADLSQELFTYKSRVQEQEQIIVSLRRDLAGMTARLSDLQGELTEKQKRQLEKSEATIREQTKELNETRLKLSKLSDIVDKQTQQIESLQTDLSKSKVLADQYQLLVDQRQNEIDRLSKNLEQKTSLVERVEKTNQDEGRITHELVAIGAQCKGERHEQTINRQREALNELRTRIKSLEQLRPANPSYEKVLQQVVLLKRELAELRARQALPTDIQQLTTTMTNASSTINISQNPTQKASSFRQSSSTSFASDAEATTQKILEERTAHAETMNALQSCDDLLNAFIRKLVQQLEIDDDSLINVQSLANIPSQDRYIALQQRQRATEILAQKIEMLRERLTRKEDLLKDYEKDLGKLRQAEILLREKEHLLQDLETDKRAKDDETFFLRNTLKETQDNLNQEKRVNASIKLGRNVDQNQSTDLIRRSGNSTLTLHHHCPPDSSGKVRTVKRTMNEKLVRKDYEIKTLKQELNEALDKISDQSHQVKLLELQTNKPS